MVSPCLMSLTSIWKIRNGHVYDSEVFRKAIEGFSKEDAVLRQYWGEQVDNPGIVTWVADFAVAGYNLGEMMEIMLTESYAFALESLDKIFEEPDDNNLAIPTLWSSPLAEVDAAMQAPITEVAYFSFSSEHLGREEGKKIIESEMEMICAAVKKYGNAKGAAIGWVGDEGDKEIFLHGVFGYDTLEDHMEWRKHPEFSKAQDAFERIAEKKIVFKPKMEVKGILPEGYFHVKFEHIE